MYIIMNPFM